jgi:acetyl-CoA synthetase
MAQTPPQTIETILLEERRYPPSEEFAAQANATAEIYDRDFEEFWVTEGLVFDREVE